MQYLNFSIRKNSTIVLSFIVLTLAGCSKGRDTAQTPPVGITESDIAFKVDITGSEVNYINVFPVVGTSQLFYANITSTLPRDELTVDVTVKKKSDNTVVFTIFIVFCS